jgi:hypothetical protein
MRTLTPAIGQRALLFLAIGGHRNETRMKKRGSARYRLLGFKAPRTGDEERGRFVLAQHQVMRATTNILVASR